MNISDSLGKEIKDLFLNDWKEYSNYNYEDEFENIEEEINSLEAFAEEWPQDHEDYYDAIIENVDSLDETNFITDSLDYTTYQKAEAELLNFIDDIVQEYKKNIQQKEGSNNLEEAKTSKTEIQKKAGELLGRIDNYINKDDIDHLLKMLNIDMDIYTGNKDVPEDKLFTVIDQGNIWLADHLEGEDYLRVIDEIGFTDDEEEKYEINLVKQEIKEDLGIEDEDKDYSEEISYWEGVLLDLEKHGDWNSKDHENAQTQLNHFRNLQYGDNFYEESKEMKTEATSINIPGLDKYENIADSFDNYKAFKNNFGEIIIIKDKYDNQYKVYKPNAEGNSSYIYYATSRDNIEGWLYGAVMANNGIFKDLK